MKTVRHTAYQALGLSGNSNDQLFGDRGVLIIVISITIVCTLSGLVGFLLLCTPEPPVRMDHLINSTNDKRDLSVNGHLDAKEKAAPFFLEHIYPYEKDTD